MRGFVVLAVLLAGTAVADAKQVACVRPAELTLPVTAPDPTDHFAPRTPAELSVWVETGHAKYGERYEVASVGFTALLAEDTALVRITIVDSTGHTETLLTTPHNRYLCPSGQGLSVSVASGEATATVTAIDLAGNESSANTTASIHAPHRHHGCGMAIVGLLMIFPVIAIFVAIGLFIRSALRRKKLALPGTAMAPLVAETMTRAVIADTLFTITWGFALSLMLYFSNDEIWAAFVGIVPMARLLRLIAAKRVLGLIECGTPAELHDNLLAANGRYIVVADRIVKDALVRSVPAAINRKR